MYVVPTNITVYHVATNIRIQVFSLESGSYTFMLSFKYSGSNLLNKLLFRTYYAKTYITGEGCSASKVGRKEKERLAKSKDDDVHSFSESLEDLKGHVRDILSW